jgi:hypothetical protein
MILMLIVLPSVYRWFDPGPPVPENHVDVAEDG